MLTVICDCVDNSRTSPDKIDYTQAKREELSCEGRRSCFVGVGVAIQVLLDACRTSKLRCNRERFRAIYVVSMLSPRNVCSQSYLSPSQGVVNSSLRETSRDKEETWVICMLNVKRQALNKQSIL